MGNRQREPNRAGRTQDHFVSDIVRDVMSSQPRIVSASATVVEAAEVMRREDIGALMVVDEGPWRPTIVWARPSG